MHDSFLMAPVDSHQVLAGSYFAVAGALLGLIRPRKLSLSGMLLVQWGLIKGLLFQKHMHEHTSRGVYTNPAMVIAIIAAFLSIKKDVKKILRSGGHWKMTKHLKSS